jgi:hypothetical protein
MKEKIKLILEEIFEIIDEAIEEFAIFIIYDLICNPEFRFVLGLFLLVYSLASLIYLEFKNRK